MEEWGLALLGVLSALVLAAIIFLICRYRNDFCHCNSRDQLFEDEDIDVVDLYMSTDPRSKAPTPSGSPPEFIIPIVPYFPQIKPSINGSSSESPGDTEAVSSSIPRDGQELRHLCQMGRRYDAIRMPTLTLQSELDISLYEDGGDGEVCGLSTIHSKGRLHLAVVHDDVHRCVIVNILGVAGVRYDTGDTYPDTCFKVKLKQKPHETESNEECSRIFPGSANAKYDASFCFFVTEKLKPKKASVICIFNTVDKFSRMSEIGQVRMKLSDIEMLVGARRLLDTWRDIIPTSAMLRCYGELSVSLRYSPSDGILTSCVIQGRKLVRHDNQSVSDDDVLYVKLAMLSNYKILRRRKSSTRCFSGHPKFHDEHKFEVNPEALSKVTLVFTVFSRDPRGRSRMLGKMNVGSLGYSFGEGLEHWSEMIRNPYIIITRWHTLM